MRDHEPNQLFLTFDVEGLPPREDFFDNTSLMCLRITLDLLDDVGFKGVFFITASAAERIQRYPIFVQRLSRHEIGYHSSSHSVRPRIIEYTDVASYEEAMAISLERETSHINPETGQIEGSGGILALRETFPKNDIVSFRAPFLAWSPPHLEALKKLGIRFDFSSNFSRNPVSFNGITFYPTPISIDDGVEATFVHKGARDIFPKPLISIVLRGRVTVLLMHPPSLAIRDIYVDRKKYQKAGNMQAKIFLCFLKMLLERIKLLQNIKLIEVTPSLSDNWPYFDLKETDAKRIYWQSIQNPMHLFNCNPRFVVLHFMRFFDEGNVRC